MGNSGLEEVQKIYSDVSEWLKFAEAKHAGLFAVWVAILSATITMDGFLEMDIVLKSIIIIAICIGIMIELFSFFPFLNRLKFLKKKCYKKYSYYSGNAVFYQAIFVDTFCENNMEASADLYRNVLSQRGIDEASNKLITDYIKQIIEVATIGTIKIYLFSIATKYVFVIIIATIVMLIIA